MLLNSYHCLRREICEQCYLLVGKGANFLTVNADHPYRLVLFEHRRTQKGASAPQLGNRCLGFFGCQVENVEYLFRIDGTIRTLRKPAVVNGAPRSDVNTKGHLLTLNLRRQERCTPPEDA
jgi:hypothetical protein